jgi:hypothetical protein
VVALREAESPTSSRIWLPPPCTSTISCPAARARDERHSRRARPALELRAADLDQDPHESPALLEAEHQVHVLQRLARRALQEVVDRRDEHDERAARATRDVQSFVFCTRFSSGSPRR